MSSSMDTRVSALENEFGEIKQVLLDLCNDLKKISPTEVIEKK